MEATATRIKTRLRAEEPPGPRSEGPSLRSPLGRSRRRRPTLRAVGQFSTDRFPHLCRNLHLWGTGKDVARGSHYMVASPLVGPRRELLTALEEALEQTRQEMLLTQERINAVARQLAAYQQLQGEHQTLTMRLGQLATEFRGLQAAVSRRRLAAEGNSPEDDWTTLTRPQAVVRVLAESEEPLGPMEIVTALREHGRIGDQSRGVSVALMRLKKRGEVRAIERGKWVLPALPSHLQDNDAGEEVRLIEG